MCSCDASRRARHSGDAPGETFAQQSARPQRHPDGHNREAPARESTAEIGGGELIGMVGGEPEQYDRWREMLTIFDPNPRLVGNVGKAAALKLALNHLIGSLTTSFSLSLAIVIEEEIPVDIFMGILRGSA